jgi:hypothetical protein
MNQVRFEGFHSLKLPAVKSPMGQNDGHFRIERKGNGPELYDIFLPGVRLVVWNRQQNLVPAHAKIADKLGLGSHHPVHLGREGFRKEGDPHGVIIGGNKAYRKGSTAGQGSSR